MAKPEQCGHCNKPATIHLTQIIQNKIHKVDLCEDCPFKKGVTDPEGFSLADFIMKHPSESGAHIAGECESCGMKPSDFKKTGRFGCPDCYKAFGEMVNPMLSNMHRDTVHRGKVPEAAMSRVAQQRKLDELKESLQLAIKEERYEDAAKLRDEIADEQSALSAAAQGESNS